MPLPEPVTLVKNLWPPSSLDPGCVTPDKVLRPLPLDPEAVTLDKVLCHAPPLDSEALLIKKSLNFSHGKMVWLQKELHPLGMRSFTADPSAFRSLQHSLLLPYLDTIRTLFTHCFLLFTWLQINPLYGVTLIFRYYHLYMRNNRLDMLIVCTLIHNEINTEL